MTSEHRIALAQAVVNAYDLKVGSYVYYSVCLDAMKGSDYTDYVNKPAKIVRIDRDGTTKLVFKNGREKYVYTHVLLPFEAKQEQISVKLTDEYTAVVTDVVQVGCQRLTREQVMRIKEYITEHQK